MAHPVPHKRPTCSVCSKPVNFCLCTRFRVPTIDNKIAVTILQHRLELKHPLNSARIAMLGLRNVSLQTVSDVNLAALIRIRLNEAKQFAAPRSQRCDANGREQVSAKSERNDDNVVAAVVRKYGELKTVESIWTPPNSIRPNFNEIFASSAAMDALKKGFVVERLQNCNEMEADGEAEEEFEFTVPAGSVLLFPSDKAVDVREITGENFEVKNLIVLDGTWAKAKRIFKENPWLEVVPHLKLEQEGLSLYSDVRKQPKVGYLSTIESIVYAMKGLGDCHPGLDHLLDVFDSMIGDQRRCRDERMKKI